MSTSTVAVRPATPGDLAGIVEVEEAAWKEEGEIDAAAPPDLIRHRIRLCNSQPPGWFWVAEQRIGRTGKIVGSFVLQPTRMPPEACRSWDHATDDGRLVATFDPQGPFVYGVSLSVPDFAPPGTSDLLVNAIHILRLMTGKRFLYACARMSGYRRAQERTGVAPEDYWLQRRKDGTPRDPFLRHFWALIGLMPARFLPNGFPPDRESGGHGVLCISTDPMQGILNSSGRLFSAGRVSSQ